MAGIIINPVAGPARGPVEVRVALARRALNEAGVDGEVIVSAGPGDARVRAAQLARDCCDLVVAWGGDGTVNEVASSLAFTGTALGIVPAGSGNGLARELGVSMRPAAALRAALAGRARPLDAGELDGRLFVNIAGIGFDAEVARRFNARPPGRRGAWPYVTLTLGALWSYEPDRYQVTLDDERYDGRFLTIVLANGVQFGNRMRVAPEARPDDGLLNALLVDHRSIAGHLWRARHLLRDPTAAEGVVRRSVRAAVIEGTRPLACQIDGESFTAGVRVEARVHPGALTLRM